jgi:hypothetical protein
MYFKSNFCPILGVSERSACSDITLLRGLGACVCVCVCVNEDYVLVLTPGSETIEVL